MSNDVHTLSGAYALDALAPEEAVEFRRHLAECPACRDEVRELRKAAARMGAAEATAPPPELKARILAAAARTPQSPPRPADQPSDERVDPPSEGSAPPARHRRRPAVWLATAAAAVVLVAGGAIGFQALQGDDPALSPSVTLVLEAADVRTRTVETANGGRLTVGVSPSRNEMAVDTSGLPDPGEGQVYQLWALHGSDIVSAGIVDDPDEGAAMGMPGEDTEVALTVEPAGGSEQPTSDPIVRVDPRELLTT